MSIEVLSTILFGLAILHTFLASTLIQASHQFPEGTTARSIFHLLGEVEVVFGFWAAIFLITMASFEAPSAAVAYVEKIKFTEPLFVFVIMVVCSTRPILMMAREFMSVLSSGLQRFCKMPQPHADIFVLLGLGPVLGSFITEPAAMTVIALLLKAMMEKVKPRLLYALVAVLFVNVSIGGSLTSFAAPPILMVAGKWDWDLQFVMTHFGWKSALAGMVNSILLLLIFWKEIAKGFKTLKSVSDKKKIPFGLKITQLLFLILIVLTHTHSNVFMGLFLLFLGLTVVTERHQENLRMREALLVAFFLAGLMVFGEFQKWWLQPLLAQLSDRALFLGATALTAVTDNAALTYLGSQVDGLSGTSQYALVAGALAGGGLTVLANAPNPAGYSILISQFPKQQINHLKFFFMALPPTIVAGLALWFL